MSLKLKFDLNSGYVAIDNCVLPEITNDLHRDLLCNKSQQDCIIVDNCKYWHPCLMLYRVAKCDTFTFLKRITQMIVFYRRNQELFSLVIDFKRFNKDYKYEQLYRNLETIDMNCKCLNVNGPCENYNCCMPYWINANKYFKTESFKTIVFNGKILKYLVDNIHIYCTNGFKMKINNQFYIHTIYFLLILVHTKQFVQLASVIDLLLICCVGNYNYLYNYFFLRQ